MTPKRHPLYLDTEFTGLTQDADLISIALVSGEGAELYAELADVDLARCDPWVLENVLPLTRWLSRPDSPHEDRVEGETRLVYGERAAVVAALGEWLARWPAAEVWADCPAWDWVLFCELFGGARGLPPNLFYLPFDLATLLRQRGMDPDMDRALLAGIPSGSLQRHNALADARLLRPCVERLLAGS